VASPETAAVEALHERLDALHGRLDDLQEQVTALASSGASDRAVESVRVYAEGLAARVAQVERRIT